MINKRKEKRKGGERKTNMRRMSENQNRGVSGETVVQMEGNEERDAVIQGVVL